MALTKTGVQKLKPKEKPYKKFDGGGLYVEVMPSGSKLWRLKYYFQGKEKRISLGKYPIITLVNAREKRLAAKRLLDQGMDPSRDKMAQQRLAKTRSTNTFQALAMEWYNKQTDRWRPRYAKTVMYRLERNVFPFIGSLPITDIKTPELLTMLQVMENRNALDVAVRTRQICGQVFRYAIQTGRCDHNPAANLIGATKSYKKQHFPALDIKEVPTFLKKLDQNRTRLYPQTIRAIYFSLLTFARPGEIRQAQWAHIDMEGAEWIIPAEFMKMGRDHVVPLSQQVLEILQDQRADTAHLRSPWVFPGQKKSTHPMSDGTVNMAIKRMGYKGRMTAHGVRALARTTIREKLKYYPDIIEAQLAHKPPGPLGAAYDRAQFLDERKTMMQDWTDYLMGIGGIMK